MTDRPQPDEVTKQTWREAERQHDELIKREEIHARQVEAFSVLGMRSLGLIAASGIAAALGVYSANYDRLRRVPNALDALNATLSCFFISLMLMLACILLAYFSQVLFADSLASTVRTFEYPYRTETKQSVRSNFWGGATRWAAIVCALASAGMIVTGGVMLLKIIR